MIFAVRSDVDNPIVQKVFGVVKRNRSEAQRRKKAASGVRHTRGKRRQPLSPPQHIDSRGTNSAPVLGLFQPANRGVDRSVKH